MPITTFLNNNDKIKFTSVTDKELNNLFQEVRKIDNRYLLQEKIFIKKKLFTKLIIEKNYTLYFDYLYPDSNRDIQIVNLNDDIFGIDNTKNNIMNYFYGFLAGYERRSALC